VEGLKAWEELQFGLGNAGTCSLPQSQNDLGKGASIREDKKGDSGKDGNKYYLWTGAIILEWRAFGETKNRKGEGERTPRMGRVT